MIFLQIVCIGILGVALLKVATHICISAYFTEKRRHLLILMRADSSARQR